MQRITRRPSPGLTLLKRVLTIIFAFPSFPAIFFRLYSVYEIIFFRLHFVAILSYLRHAAWSDTLAGAQRCAESKNATAHARRSLLSGGPYVTGDATGRAAGTPSGSPGFRYRPGYGFL